MKFAIIDQSLQDYDGHHFEYDLAVAAAATGLGLETLVLGNRAFAEAETGAMRVVPWFSQGSYGARNAPLAGAALRMAEGLPGPLRLFALNLMRATRTVIGATKRSTAGDRGARSPFGAQITDAVRAFDLQSNDHVLVHSFMLPELLALAGAMAEATDPPHLHLVLRRDPDEPQMRAQTDNGIAHVLAAIAKLPFFETKIHLYADTWPLARAYAALVQNKTVQVVPIPHCLPAASSVKRAPGAPLRLVYLGNARSEKGFQHLPQMVADNWRDLFATGCTRLIAQSNAPLGLDAALMAPALRSLRGFGPGHVELIDRPLSVAEFQNLLFCADLVLLPYDAMAYGKRSSGILIQAAVAGKPVVVPEDSWLAEAAVPGAHVTFGKGRSLGQAVRLAVDEIARLSEAARSHQAEVRDRHSATRLVQMMLEHGQP